MDVFYITLNQMFTLFSLILLGFVLGKKGILPKNSDTVMSRLEMYIFLPALTLSNLLKNCSVEAFAQNASLILYGLIFVLVAIILSYPLSALFVKNIKGNPDKAYQRNIYKYAMAFGNFGFLGNAIVLSVWGSDMLFKYTMFTFFLSVFCYSWGLLILTPKEQGEISISAFLKRLMVPAMLAIPIGVIGGFLQLERILPSFIMTILNNASSCMGPTAMILAGYVIAQYDLKEMLFNKKVYIATFLRLIVIPTCMLMIMKLLNMHQDVMILVLVSFAAPLGLNTIVYPANYGCDTKTGASMAMISNTFAVITIPLLYLLFIVL
ncbi:MAG: AEC family transporter [Clostridia bacterium]|nr:AEC family transporter [Clostridia bacterium]